MSYGDLLRALGDEVREQAQALRESAKQEGVRLLDEARRLSESARREALYRLAEEKASGLERARVRASLAEERTLLAERRRLLDDVRREVRSRLPRLSTPALSVRLLEEVLGDDDGSPLRLVVDPGHAAPCQEHLSSSRPGIVDRTEIVEGADPRGGVELQVGDWLSVDDTLPTRLGRIWPRLEAELAPLLFGGPDGFE